MAKKVLIIDDEVPFCKLMAGALHQSGLEALTAFSGESGLEVYRREQPDLILLDLAMPGISGFDVAAAIRADEKRTQQHTLIVLLTAHANSFTVSVEFHTGIDSYLTKPALPQDVVAHVQNLLAGVGIER